MISRRPIAVLAGILPVLFVFFTVIGAGWMLAAYPVQTGVSAVLGWIAVITLALIATDVLLLVGALALWVLAQPEPSSDSNSRETAPPEPGSHV